MLNALFKFLSKVHHDHGTTMSATTKAQDQTYETKEGSFFQIDQGLLSNNYLSTVAER